MQEGAGVRQIVEDELRALGMRLRDLDVRLELGLQESVRSAVQAGYGVAFISRSAVESELADRDADVGAGRRARREAGDLAGSRRRTHRHTRRRRVRRVRARPSSRLDRSLGYRRARGARGRSIRSSSRALGGVTFSTPPNRWEEVPSHRIEVPEGVDTIVAIGGGSAIDTAKAASAATGFPLVSVPTTYSGAEWTTFFGVRDPDRRMRGGGAGARLHAIVYEPELTLDLPRAETVGTALNALAHGAEALYVEGHNAGGRCRRAGRSAADRRVAAARRRATRTISRRAPVSCAARATQERPWASPSSRSATRWRRVLGGRYGVAHGALNALTLPPALRFNEPVAGEAIARFGAALGSDDPAATGRGARAPRRLRAPARPRHPGRGARRGRRGRGGASGREGESAPGHARRCRAAPTFDLVEPRLRIPTASGAS